MTLDDQYDSVTSTDDAVAVTLARGAGRLLLALREQRVLPGRELADAGDAIAQQFLSRALRVLRPADAVLSEEATDSAARLSARRTWIIDPLDGTREYSEGRDDWAVHVALCEAGGITSSAVALPAMDLCLSSSTPPRVPDMAARQPRMAVSRSRAPELVGAVARHLGADLVPMGSAGFKAMAVVRGEVDIYLHAGGQYEWDSAAPVGVALAAGLHASRIDGGPLVYNRPDPYLPDLLICRRELAEPVLAAIAGAMRVPEPA